VGSDIGGSIRVPAHFNGLFGLKPSRGVVSDRGHIPFMPDLNVMGPLARSTEDLGVLLDASMRVRSMSVGGVAPVPGAALPSPTATGLTGLRVGLWLDDPVAPVDSTTRAGIEQFTETLSAAGALVDPSVRPAMASSDLHDIYSRLLSAVNGAGWPQGVRERFAAVAQTIDGPLDAGDPETFLRRLARDGIADHASWMSANERRIEARRAWAELFDRVDVVLMPVSQTQAFEHDTEIPYAERMVAVDRGPDHDTHRAYHELLFWAGLATMPGLPSVVMPLGEVNGLPLGVQMVGPRWADRHLLALASTMSDAAGLSFRAPTLITG
jgi:amidase